MYVRRLRLEDVGTFRRAELTLNVPGDSPGGRALPNVTLLVGAGGAGKTTALRAIAIAALATATRGLVATSARDLIRRSDGQPARARIRAEVAGDDERGDATDASITVELRRRDGDAPRVRVTGSGVAAPMAQSPFVVGYGAHRVVPSAPGEASAGGVAGVATLFDDHAKLVHLDSWLPRLCVTDRARGDEIIGLLRNLAVARVEPLRAPVDGRLRFRVGGHVQAFDALSAGQRAHLGWIGDLLFHAHLPSAVRVADIAGLVLIDQIDLHLHPDAQREVVPALARAFPKLQFVITTHSPIVVGSVWRSNVRIVEDAEGGATIVASTREVFGLSSDQLLAGHHFGVASTRNVEIDRRVQRESRAARKGDADAAVRVLRLLSLGGAAFDDEARSAVAR